MNGCKVPPEHLPVFQQLVVRAKQRQHGKITARQYGLLEAAHLRANEPHSSPMFGWYFIHRELLRRALSEHGIEVKPDRVPRPHRYRLSSLGMTRLTELEQKIRRSKG